jgi:pimeloyl-ACP methyl ester carboxylesterase
MASNDDGDTLRQEARALVELSELQRDPVFYGRGVPRGDGRLVLVVPGLFGNDLYLQPLRGWLARIGYTPALSSLSLNAGCPNRLRGQVESALQRQRYGRARPVAIIGHSRGGMLAWALASRLQAEVSHLVLLGSPAPAVVRMMQQQDGYVPASLAPSAVVDAGTRALKLLDPDCNVPACGCAYTEDLRRDLSPATRVLSIYSHEDRIVPPHASKVAGVGNIEVGGSHSGLALNRAVYPHIARFLAG